MNNNEIKEYAKENYERALELVREMCKIPAPSHLEHKRAEFCKKWFNDMGAKDAYIDDALNVICPINCENSNEITVFAAHIDTVFPDTEPMPFSEDEEKMYCPGVSDDTASVAVLMLTAEYFIKNNIVPQKGVMFVCNSCEEGLGDLKGTKQLFKDYEGRISQFVSFDSNLDKVYERCIGSHRYEVEVLTEGGHSQGNFGNDNAIDVIAGIIKKIYSIQLPKKEGAVTTYNVGTITGGTSVNTIAQNAKMLCEYRSGDVECLAIIKKKFEEIFESARTEKIKVNVTLVGDRPCQNIQKEKIEKMKKIALPIIEEVIGKQAVLSEASTDCNVPLSLGISALCVGTNIHGGVHTREEWLDKKSILPGLEIGIRIARAYTNV